MVNASTPVPVAGLYKLISGIATGTYHSIAVKTDGTVWTWGYNGLGELGSGDTTDRSTPVSVPGLTGVTAVAAGEYHSLALTSGGTVWAWGYNGSGQLGDRTQDEKNSPVQVVQLTNVVAISAGLKFSVALKSDGTVWAWGDNSNGQLGDGTTTMRLTPVQVTGLSGVAQIAAGSYHVLARTNAGLVWAWGFGGFGELGTGDTAPQSNIAVKVAVLTSVTAIGAGTYHSLAVLSDGSVWAWGYNGSGQLGDGTTTNENMPVKIGATTTGFAGFAAVAGSTEFQFRIADEWNGLGLGG